jgi:D-alanyl-D-alanine carboxypeptidase/D-alanyl-D-alanine-endopeptidase (penicillin-binding protein 4)
VLRRRSRLLPAAIGVLCVFTIVAGLTVARLLPHRLALWRPPSIAAGQLASPTPVLEPASGVAAGAASVTPAGVSRALAPVLSSSAFGPSLGVLVTSLATGQVLYASNANSGFTPASTNKLATAAAVLKVLGPTARLTTRVVLGAGTGSIILVGGGDPTLAAGQPQASQYPQPATLAQLASVTAQALKSRGQHQIRLGYDTSLFTGPAFAPGWTSGYVTGGDVTQITPLEVDQGRVTPAGTPVDAMAGGARSANPAPQAAAAFAGYLVADGITVTGSPTQVVAPARAATIASVRSPPLAQIVYWMLEQSNNVIAENLARQVALATGRPASFSGAAAAVTAVLRGLGVTGELQLSDGSGLSPDDKVAPATLVQIVRLAAATAALRSMLTGLPVAGFSGTLGPGGSVFGAGGSDALGVVRAKTGNLSQVAALAGSAYAKNGQLLVFAVMADQIAPGALARAATAMVTLANALAGCGCR